MTELLNASKIVVITYDAPHRKTQDLLIRMKALGYQDIEVIATPWVNRKVYQPLIPHRPMAAMPIPPAIFVKNLGYQYTLSENDNLHEILQEREPAYLLIGGAGILPANIVESFCVLNAHPGYLPEMRGLDALKWAIYAHKVIGVTLHWISTEADTGYLIKQIETPLYFWDTFHSIAYRHYEIEIDLLSNAVKHLNSRTKSELKVLEPGQNMLYKRMPPRYEYQLLNRLSQRLMVIEPD